ncbi:hypothetical protein Dimus_036024 [Dionaea muscipula]
MPNPTCIVNGTCKTLSNGDPNIMYNFCVSVLGSDPYSKNSSLEGLGVIAFNLAILNATATKSGIENLLKDNQRFDHFAQSCLQDCLELYSDAKSSLCDGLNSFRARNYEDANVEASAAMDAPTTCEDGFKEKVGEASPLTKENDDFFQLIAIALAFTNMFH